MTLDLMHDAVKLVHDTRSRKITAMANQCCCRLEVWMHWSSVKSFHSRVHEKWCHTNQHAMRQLWWFFVKSHSRRMTSSSITQSIQQSKRPKRTCVSKSDSFCETQANAVCFLTCHPYKITRQCKNTTCKILQFWIYRHTYPFQLQNAATPQNACTSADHDSKQHSPSEHACARYSAILTPCMRCRLNATNKTPAPVQLH